MIRFTSILVLFLTSIIGFGQIDISADENLKRIKDNLPKNWIMTIEDDNIFIRYQSEIIGIYRGSENNDHEEYNANVNATIVNPADTMHIEHVTFILYGVADLVSKKELKASIKHNIKLRSQIEELPEKMNITTRPGKAGPNSMLIFESEIQEWDYNSEKRKLTNSLKEEYYQYSEKYSYAFINYPYLGDDIEWQDAVALKDEAYIKELIQSEIKTYALK